MRDLVVHAWTSADGFSVDAGTEVMQAMIELDVPAGEDDFSRTLAAAGTHIMGRVSYLEMAEFWPKSSHVNAAPMNDIPKVVFSRTLRETSWEPASWILTGTVEPLLLALAGLYWSLTRKATCWVSTPDVLGSNAGSPEYAAVIECDPAAV